MAGMGFVRVPSGSADAEMLMLLVPLDLTGHATCAGCTDGMQLQDIT